MRKLASIQNIKSLSAIENADKIETAEILGWKVVVEKGIFKTGDTVVYVEIDSILPERPEFEFLRKNKFRIKTIRLRGQVSQGIVFPLSILPFGNYSAGDDVTEVLGVKKYDPQLESENAIASMGKFPSDINKTDEDRIQLFPNICQEYTNVEFEATEKLDGQSATFFLRRKTKWFFFSEYEFGVCSRNHRLPEPDGSNYWKIATMYSIKDALKYLGKEVIGKFDLIVLQGEIVGAGIQKNKYNLNGIDFYAYNVIIDGRQIKGTSMRWGLDKVGIKSVPVVIPSFYLPATIDECVELSKGLSKLNTTLREGIVVRNYKEGISFKVINPDFLIKNDE